MLLKTFAIIICLLGSQTAQSAKILAIFPTQSPSHYILVQPLFKELAARGHEITALTPYPQKKPIRNFRDIIVLEDYNEYLDAAKDNQAMHDMSIWQFFDMIYTMSTGMARSMLAQKEIKQLLSNRKQTFDLIIIDMFVNDALLGFAAHFGASIIGVAPFGAHTWHNQLMGAPTLPSFMPYPFLNYSNEMTFMERLHNFYAYVCEYFFFNFKYLPAHQKIFAQHFKHTGKTLNEMRRNFSLVLLNQHSSLGVMRPYLPNMIEVGGMQVSNKINALPANMAAFLDNATAGAIYFSLGSNIKSENVPREKLNGMLNTFRALPQRVLWKFENVNLTNQPDNVFISSWFPQSDVLAHPNIKLFITHGGLLSTTESIARGKPVLGMPFFADQMMNIARAKRMGFALSLDYNEFSELKFKQAIKELLTNAKYTQMAKKMSQRYHDKPQTALETAIYWVEYVLRHEGAHHMRSAGLNLNSFQYYGLDVIALVLVGVVALFIVLNWGISLCNRHLLRSASEKAKLQ